MIDGKKVKLFKELLDGADSILIMCGDDVVRDQLFASTSLYAVLKENTNKNVKLLTSTNFSKKETDIAYLNEAKNEIGHENLCISLDYIDDSIDKVTYHVNDETQKFYLTVKPKKGFSPLSKENVEFSYTGADADMIILMGVDELESLDSLYYGYDSLFNNTTLVSINSYETDFGNFKFDILGTSSFSEFVAQLLSDLEIDVSSEVATNLLSGINEETDGFSSYTATADTFEVVSKLMRSGARRASKKTTNNPITNEDIKNNELLVKEEKQVKVKKNKSTKKKKTQDKMTIKSKKV